MPKIEVFAPRHNVNDDSVTVVDLCVEDRAFVDQDTLLLVVETSKATFEINSPCGGYVQFLVELSQDVPIEKPLCVLVDKLEELSGITVSSQNNGFVAPAETTPPALSRTKNDIPKDRPCVSIGVNSDHTSESQITIAQWLAADETTVNEGQPICRVVTMDDVIELTAPRNGFVKFLAQTGETVATGEPICMLGEGLSGINEYHRACLQSSDSKSEDTVHPAIKYDPEQFSRTPRRKNGRSVRFSRKAKEIILKYGVEESTFAQKGLVSSKDVLQYLGKLPAPAMLPAQLSLDTRIGVRNSIFDVNIVEGVAAHEKKITRTKRDEIVILAGAQSSALTSQVSMLVQTHGVFSACRNNPNFSGQMSNTILFETSRLLKKYPMFNAGYRDGHIVYYDEINVGFAMDIERGLKVPVFKKTDELSLDEINLRKQAFLEKYLMNKLRFEDISGGTFTISDLSEQETWLFNPIINKGQAAILGVGGEQSIAQDLAAYPLVLAFDHRLAEGMVASKFLKDLKARLLSHESVLLRQMGRHPEGLQRREEEIHCQECFRSIQEINAWGYHLLKTLTADGKERRVCSLCTAGGW